MAMSLLFLLYLASWDHFPNKQVTFKSLSQDLLLGDSNLSHFLFKYGQFKIVFWLISPYQDVYFNHMSLQRHCLLHLLDMNLGPLIAAFVLWILLSSWEPQFVLLGMESFPPCNTWVPSFLSSASPAVASSQSQLHHLFWHSSNL